MRLPETLKHLLFQQGIENIPWEVVLVNNNSTDNTEEVAHSILSESKINFKIVREPVPGLFYARIKGISVSAFNLLAYVDDDNWLDRNYLKNAYDIMSKNPNVGICGGVGVGVFESFKPEWFNRFENAYAVGKLGRVKEGILPDKESFLYGAGLVIRKKAYSDIQRQGFKPLLTGRIGNVLTAGDDSELCIAVNLAGWKSYYSSALTFKHYIPNSRLTWKYFLKMNVGFGNSYPILFLYKKVSRGNNLFGFVFTEIFLQCNFNYIRSLLMIFLSKDKIGAKVNFIKFKACLIMFYQNISTMYLSYCTIKKFYNSSKINDQDLSSSSVD